MKKLFCLIFLSIPLVSFGQSLASLTVFSENRDKFYLFLDGKKQNEIARSHIRIQGLPDLYYSAKIIFEDSAIAPISKSSLYVSDGDDVMKDASYKISRDKTSKAKLSFYSMFPVQKDFVATVDMYVFDFGHPGAFDSMPGKEKKENLAAPANSGTFGSFTVFSQNGDQFFLFLDGVKQNEAAQSNIRIESITGLYYNVKIVFKDTKIPPVIKNNVFIADADDNLMDASYRLRRDNTGKPRFNFYSMNKVQEKFAAPAGMYVYDFKKADENIAATPAAKAKKIPVKGTVSNIKVTEQPSGALVKGKKVAVINNKSLAGNTNSPNATIKEDNTNISSSDKKEGTPEIKKCNGWPMGKADLATARKLISGKAKEDDKLTAAKDILAANCFLSSQVTEFCALFKSEKSKLAFAKYAYKFTIDRKNYAEVNKAFSLETSKRELSKFINGS